MQGACVTTAVIALACCLCLSELLHQLWVNKQGAALTATAATADQLHMRVSTHKHSRCSHTDAEREDMKAFRKQYANMMVTVSIQSPYSQLTWETRGSMKRCHESQTGW